MSISEIHYDGHNAGIRNRYPYTDFHEMNLDWLVTNYQAIIDKVNETIEWANNHQTEYEAAMVRLAAVENEIATFEAQVREAFAQQKAEIDAEFAEQKAALEQALADTQAEVEREIAAMIAEVNTAIASFDVRFNELSRNIQSEFTALKLQVNDAIAQLQQDLLENNEFVFEYVENRLDQFIADFPELIGIQVYNPVRGQMTGLQQAINDLYDVACVEGITALEFDTLDLTAQEFDDLDLTAREFDQHGYFLLGYPDPRYYMYDPFSGEMNLVKNVVTKLAGLHTGEDSLSANEFDVLDLTAEEFDDSDITAFNFDWYGETILTA